jgi:hypothetical protein
MSDDMPLKLPRYVFRRANGSFRYKRNVPERLRPLIGKATLYRQLGDSYREAMQALPLVHARIEALLNDEANNSARERSLEIIRGALGDEVAEMVLAETVPEYSPIEDALNELGKDLHKQKMPTEVVQQVYTGKLKPDVLTLAMTLDQYEAYKSDSPKAAREIGQRIERLRTDMKSVFGKQKLKYTPLTDITRQDANDLRDHLLSRVSANPHLSVDRVVKRYAHLRSVHRELHGTVFHSTRKWFITQCERTGVPEHFTATLVGHHSARSANKLTYGLYSAGISDAQKREIVEGIRLPQA